MTLDQRIAYYVGQGYDLKMARINAEEDIRVRLFEISEHNDYIRMHEGKKHEKVRKEVSIFGNVESISDYVNKGDFIVDERVELENDLANLLLIQRVALEQERQEKIEQDKLARQTRLDEVNRKATLNEAYKFFTYLDTATTKGYDVSGLSSDEVLDLYNIFRNNENYRAKYEETIARMQTEDREVIIPVPNDAMKDGQNLKQQVEENKPSDFSYIRTKIAMNDKSSRDRVQPESLQNPCLENEAFEETFKCQTHVGYEKGEFNFKNDDFAITVSHPTLGDTKLMIVADGVGGCGDGDVASQQFCKYMKLWFEQLETDDISPESLREAIMAVDRLMAKENAGKYGFTPSTVASTILITPTETFVSTVGDTRVYLETEYGLEPLVRAECHYDKAMELGETIDVPVYYARLMPSGYIGYGSNSWDLCCPEVEVIPNDSYKGILAISDGVYKETNDDYLQAIFDKCDSEDLADCIVEFSSEGNLSAPEYRFEGLEFGKVDTDNITVAVYRKNPVLSKQASRPKVKSLC